MKLSGAAKPEKEAGTLIPLERRVRSIQSKGRVEGRKMLETSFNEMESTFDKSVEKLLDDLTSEVQL